MNFSWMLGCILRDQGKCPVKSLDIAKEPSFIVRRSPRYTSKMSADFRAASANLPRTFRGKNETNKCKQKEPESNFRLNG